MEPVGLKVPALGSYSSAEDIAAVPSFLSPPAISTRPSSSNVAVCPILAVAMDPVGLNLPVVGS